jgi:pre-mRNA-splicing factor CDC5/CEF1
MPKLQMHEEDELRAAKSLIEDELALIDHPLKAPKNDDSDDDEDMGVSQGGVSAAFLGQAWDGANGNLMFLPSKKRYGDVTSVSAASALQAHKQAFSLAREQLGKDLKKAAKSEQRLNIVLGGYHNRVQTLRVGFTETHNTLRKCQQERGCFQLLGDMETTAAPQRVRILEKEVAILESTEDKLQARYVHLTKEREQLLELLGSA